MKLLQITFAFLVAISVNAYAIVNGAEVDTKTEPRLEVVKIIDSKYGNCTGTLIAHKWVLTADHCIGGGKSGYNDLAFESWGTIDKSYEKTKMNKGEYFTQMQIGVRNGRPEIKGGWQTFTAERAVSFRVIPENFELCSETTYPPTDQYVNVYRCSVINSNETNYNLNGLSDIGLVRLSEAQNINATGYIIDIDALPPTPTERTGYLNFSDGSLMDVEVYAYAPVKNQAFLETPLMFARGGVSYPIFTDGGNNALNNTDYGSIPYYAGSASTIRFDNKDDTPVYAQGGNSGAGVRLINPYTNDYDIFGVLSSQYSPLSMSEALNKNALTRGMSEVVEQKFVPQASGDDAYWQQLEFIADTIATTTNAAFPSEIGSLQYEAFNQTLLHEVYALNSPKQITVTSSQPEQVRVQNLSPETLDLKSILTVKESNGILITNYETVGVKTLSSDCSSVKPFQSCVITVEVQDDTAKGAINMAFSGSKQPDQELLINENVKQGNWLEETAGGGETENVTDSGNGTDTNGVSDTNDTSNNSSGGSMGLFTLLGMFWLARNRYLESSFR